MVYWHTKPVCICLRYKSFFPLFHHLRVWWPRDRSLKNNHSWQVLCFTELSDPVLLLPCFVNWGGKSVPSCCTILYFRALSLCSWNMRFLFISRDTTTDTFFRIVFHTDSSLLVFFRLNTRCYDKHALRADAPIPRMFSLSSCTMTLLYLCLTDTDTIIPLRLPPPVSPPVWPSLLFYFCTIPCSLVPVTSHLYSLIWYALDPMMYINPCIL